MSKLLTKLSVAALVVMSIGDYATVSIDGEGDLPPASTSQPSNSAVTSGQVRFQGQVLANTCSVATNSRDVLVKLPAVKANELAKNSESAKGNTPFQITLEGCPLAGYVSNAGVKKSNVSIYFDNTAAAATTDGSVLRVQNPTPYYITYEDVVVKQGNKEISDIIKNGMVAPFSDLTFTLRHAVSRGDSVEWSVINDFGGSTKGVTSLR